jgi:hypothetical protein
VSGAAREGGEDAGPASGTQAVAGLIIDRIDEHRAGGKDRDMELGGRIDRRGSHRLGVTLS